MISALALMHDGLWVRPGRTTRHRTAPFARSLDLFADSKSGNGKIDCAELALPVIVQTSEGTYVRPRIDVYDFLRLEFDVSRLNRIQKYLWLAGLPRGARPLHKQLLLNRSVLLTEQAGLHMVWQQSRFFVKPLPLFLLRRDYWHDYLCLDDSLYQNACGFFLSYIWLVSYRSDLQIAHKLGLIAHEIGWREWTSLVEDFLEHVDLHASDSINPRYRYGELRLTRLNWIYRFGFTQINFRNLRRGYFQGPDWYTQFLRENFGWLIAVFAYVTIVLSALQVGLATRFLTENSHFQKLSYGLTILALAVPAMVVGIIFFSSAMVVFFSVKSTRQYNHQVESHPGLYVGASKVVR